MTVSIPSKIYTSWVLSFIDDELTQIPHRATQSHQCIMTYMKSDGIPYSNTCSQIVVNRNGNDGYYRVHVSLDSEDLYYQKNNTCEYGIRSSIILLGKIGDKLDQFTFAIVHDLPPRQLTKFSGTSSDELDTCVQENSFTVPMFVPSTMFSETKIQMFYDFKTMRHMKYITGCHAQIPFDIVADYVITHREMIHQEITGL